MIDGWIEETIEYESTRYVAIRRDLDIRRWSIFEMDGSSGNQVGLIIQAADATGRFSSHPPAGRRAANGARFSTLGAALLHAVQGELPRSSATQ